MEAMEKFLDENTSEKLLQTLISGVKPALGCTEPVAVGLATAKAVERIKGELKSIRVEVSPNIYKNGMGVGIPGTVEIGLVFAAALGVTCGDSNLGFEVFRHVNKEAISQANDLLDKNLVQVDPVMDKGDFFIEAEVVTSEGKGICIIRDSHTNIVYIESNGKVIFNKGKVEETNSNSNDYLKELELKDIRKFVEEVDFADIEFMLDGVKINMDIARAGLDLKPGPGLGAAIDQLISEGFLQDDIVNKARVLTSAASDARMAGLNMPVMSSAGSGNHGLTAIIPPTVVCEQLACDDEKLARTLAFSHLVTAYVKVFTGVLSPICGCAVAAGAGATASITWALGGNDEQIGGSIKNIMGTLAGMVCDGAKGGCAFKLSTAASEAVMQAKLARSNVFINGMDGLLSPKAEDAIRNLGKFTKEGMLGADEKIIEIMLKNYS